MEKRLYTVTASISHIATCSILECQLSHQCFRPRKALLPEQLGSIQNEVLAVRLGRTCDARKKGVGKMRYDHSPALGHSMDVIVPPRTCRTYERQLCILLDGRTHGVPCATSRRLRTKLRRNARSLRLLLVCQWTESPSVYKSKHAIYRFLLRFSADHLVQLEVNSNERTNVSYWQEQGQSRFHKLRIYQTKRVQLLHAHSEINVNVPEYKLGLESGCCLFFSL